MWVWYCIFLLLAEYGCFSINLANNGEIGLLFGFQSVGNCSIGLSKCSIGMGKLSIGFIVEART